MDLNPYHKTEIVFFFIFPTLSLLNAQFTVDAQNTEWINKKLALLQYSSCIMLLLLLFNCQVVSESLQPHWLDLQAPLSMGFPRQEYWSGLTFYSPGGFSSLEIKLASPALQTDSLPLNHQGSPPLLYWLSNVKFDYRSKGNISFIALPGSSLQPFLLYLLISRPGLCGWRYA